MYEHMSVDLILNRMMGRVSNKLDKREASIIFDALSPAAMELQLMYMEFERILKETFGDTASREFLIKRAAERGIKPYPATYALLKAEFTPKTLSIPLNSRFSLNEFNYCITERISDGIYKINCEEIGIQGNQYFGDLIPIDYINGLETAKLTELLIPGEDEEDTESIRSRYFSTFDTKSFGGNRKDYIDKTNSIAGVGATKVTRVWNSDISPSMMIPTQAVTKWYETIISTLDKEVANWLTTIYTAAIEKKLVIGGSILIKILNSNFDKASSTLINTVQNEIDPNEATGEGFGIAPIGHVVKIDTAEEVKINISSVITFDDGYNFSSLKPQIEKILSDYLLELRKNWALQNTLVVRISQIETRILAIKGVVDITNTKINGQQANAILSKYQIPIIGAVTT